MSMFFDSVDDIVVCGRAAEINNIGAGGGLSIMAWVYAFTRGENTRGVIAAKRPSGSTTGTWRFGFHPTTNNALDFNNSFSGGDTARAMSIGTFPLKVWRHVCATTDGKSGAGSGGNMHIYINGVEADYSATTNGSGGGGNSDASVDLTIGNRNGQAETFHGLIAHLSIHNVILNRGEIAMAMRYPGSIRRGMVRYYMMNGYSNHEPDFSDYNRDGANVFGAVNWPDLNPPINGIYVPKRISRNSFVVPAVTPSVVPDLVTKRRRRLMVAVGK